MNEPPLEPLVHSIEVRCSREAAFEAWVYHPLTWWPLKEHSTFGKKASAVVFEPYVGGRIYERNRAGDERDWGRITGWDPPSTLSFTWHIYGAPEEATDVTISFQALGESRAKVTVVHSGWERLAERAAELRNANRAGWSDLLHAFSSALDR